ncbi:cupin domain-containing protein [Halopiger thermotolerans]
MVDDRRPTPTETRSLESLEQRPHARVFDGEPKTIRLALEEGEEIPPHQHPDREIVFHVLEGRVSIALGDDDHDHEVAAGELIRFDGAQEIAPTALADTTALLVLAPRAADGDDSA